MGEHVGGGGGGGGGGRAIGSGTPSCYRNSTRSEFLATCTTTSDHPKRQIDAGQVEGCHVDHQRSKYGRSSWISDRPPLFNIMVHDVDTAVKGNSADHVRRRLGDMDGHPHQTSPHKQLVCETKHETIPGSCGRGGPLYARKWIRSLFPENGVRPIPHQHLSEHGGAHQGERVEHLCIKRSQVPKYTFHPLGAYEPACRAQRAERLPSPQRDQGAICSALGEHPQDPSDRGAGPGALTMNRDYGRPGRNQSS